MLERFHITRIVSLYCSYSSIPNRLWKIKITGEYNVRCGSLKFAYNIVYVAYDYIIKRPYQLIPTVDATIVWGGLYTINTIRFSSSKYTATIEHISSLAETRGL